MNKFIFNFIFLLYLSGCKNRDSFNVEQVQEDVIISISEDYKDINSEDVFLRYPIQFIITKNSNINHMLLYVKLDNNLQSKFNDYQVLDDQYNVIYDFEKGRIDKKANFKVIFNYQTISKKKFK